FHELETVGEKEREPVAGDESLGGEEPGQSLDAQSELAVGHPAFPVHNRQVARKEPGGAAQRLAIQHVGISYPAHYHPGTRIRDRMTAMRGLIASVLMTAALLVPCAAAQPGPDFARDVQPVLESRCWSCHGPKLQ